MEFTVVLQQVTVLFILIVIGFALKKFKIITDELGKGLTGLIIYVTLPALLITAMNYEFSKEILDNSLKILLYGSFMYIFMILVSVIFMKLFHAENPQKGVYQFLVIFPNVGFMGYPILLSVFGEIAVFYGAISNLLFNILLWTLGIIFISQEKDKKINFKMLINPGIISVLIGFSLFIFSIELPYVIYRPLELIGDTTTPLAMMLVGSLLGDAKFKEMLGNARLFIISIIRLILIPLSLIFIFKFMNIPEMISSILIILSSMPAAANAAIFARKYDSDYRLASQGIFLTTLLSIGTIPLIIYAITNL
ncbi:AEC family transporter [Sporosalibacterium faouarense]|uniref:AEC family transporter n=1 Tax=Sporosalibacterium faouarense TaxID=516123 RepID=UPI00141D130E|nr:AEC family transporter [Sporosalibacterium faouarense]MTI46850.1 AEC family transporter [Bacillota bacterium]